MHGTGVGGCGGYIVRVCECGHVGVGVWVCTVGWGIHHDCVCVCVCGCVQWGGGYIMIVCVFVCVGVYSGVGDTS